MATHNSRRSDDELDGHTEIQSLDEIPKFEGEEGEAEFWATHSVTPSLFRGRGFRPGSALGRIYEERRQMQTHLPC